MILFKKRVSQCSSFLKAMWVFVGQISQETIQRFPHTFWKQQQVTTCKNNFSCCFSVKGQLPVSMYSDHVGPHPAPTSTNRSRVMSGRQDLDPNVGPRRQEIHLKGSFNAKFQWKCSPGMRNSKTIQKWDTHKCNEEKHNKNWIKLKE